MIYTLGGRVFIHQKGKVYGSLDELMVDTVWDRAMAEQERYSIQSRTADGVEQHLRAGSFIFRTTYGYYVTRERRGGANVNVVQIDEGQARIVRRIVTETIEGASLPKIATGLNRDGIVTPAPAPSGARDPSTTCCRTAACTLAAPSPSRARCGAYRSVRRTGCPQSSMRHAGGAGPGPAPEGEGGR
jgi:hypothetical protein